MIYFPDLTQEMTKHNRLVESIDKYGFKKVVLLKKWFIPKSEVSCKVIFNYSRHLKKLLYKYNENQPFSICCSDSGPNEPGKNINFLTIIQDCLSRYY